MADKKQRKSLLEPGNVIPQYIEDAAPMTCPPGMVWCPTAQMCVVSTSSSCGGSVPPPSSSTPPPTGGGGSATIPPWIPPAPIEDPPCTPANAGNMNGNTCTSSECENYSWSVEKCGSIDDIVPLTPYTWETPNLTIEPTELPAKGKINVSASRPFTTISIPNNNTDHSSTKSIPQHSVDDGDCDCIMQEEPSYPHCFFDNGKDL